ncbi:MAG: phnA protein [Proteobacteria bacterium]|nr:phnA protein [Pseudomonadota bacterium]MCP4919744.1 phnA protein [Pseudomonadota bacterium]
MAKGRDKDQAHKAAVAALGKNLSRRAKSKCELCETGGKLVVTEVAGPRPEAAGDDPSEDWAALLCDRCIDLVAGKKVDTSALRFLETAMWSELRPVQILAVRALRTVDTAWAREANDGLYLDPEVEELL